MRINRRNFLKSTAVNAAAISAIPLIVSESIQAAPTSQGVGFEGAHTILFQGDSITDAGRNRKKQLPNDAASFGSGYALMAAASLLESFPDRNLSIYNRGISGNKVYQLAERWDLDCLDLEPGLLSILIGVNDYWHKRNGNYNGTVEVYEQDYRALLERTRKELPGVTLLICEPFSVDGGTAIAEGWQEELTPYRQVARKMSEEFETLWIPYHDLFKRALEFAPAEYWCPDGVHPSMAGAQMMAHAWVKTVVGE